MKLLLFVLVVTLLPVHAVAEVCEVEGDDVESNDDLIVRSAEKCVAGDVACCRELTWIRGMGPADLRWIPEDLSTAVEKKLAEFCEGGDRVSCWTRPKVLLRLERKDEARELYAASCLDGGSDAIPGACEAAGDLHLAAGRPTRALAFFEKAGKGSALRKAGAIHESRKNRNEARRLYQQGCEDGDNEACARARRLSRRKLAPGSWEGLYGVGIDSLWIEDLGGGRIKARFHNTWANGHTCDWEGEGTVRGEQAVMDAEGGEDDEPACRPVFIREGRDVRVTDPGGACRQTFCGVRGGFEDLFEFTLR